MGINISIKVDGVIQLARALEGVATKAANTRSLITDILNIIDDRVKNVFKREGSNVVKAPKWARLSPNTRADKARKGYGSKPILERTGKLKRSFKKQLVTNTKGVYGSKVKYAPYHQQGGIKLPQRVMINLDSQTNTKITKAVQDHLAVRAVV